MLVVIAAPVDEDGEVIVADRPTELGHDPGPGWTRWGSVDERPLVTRPDVARGYRPRSDSVRTMREEGVGAVQRWMPRQELPGNVHIEVCKQSTYQQWVEYWYPAKSAFQLTVVATRLFALQPHRVETFKLSSDPLFIEKVRDIVGLYLNPPEAVLVLFSCPVRPPGRPTTTSGRAPPPCSLPWRWRQGR